MLALVLACAFLPLPPGARGALAARDRSTGIEEGDLREWMNGPVRYVMTNSERRRFRQLTSDAERAAFVRDFWRRRDPDPRTPGNEARLIFWQRVVDANKKFHVPGSPGWRTDRGKIFILLGPPEDEEENPEFDTGPGASGRGLLRWHYSGLQNARNRSTTIVAFTRRGDDDWSLTGDARFSSPYFDVNRELRDQSYGQFAMLMPNGVPWDNGATLDTLMDLGRLQEGPTEADLLHAIVNAEGFLGTYGGAARVDVVPAADGTQIAVVTAALRRGEVFPPVDESAAGLASRFAASAGLVPPGGGPPIDAPEENFVAEPTPDPEDEWVRFQALVPVPKDVPPGAWSASTVILDRVGGGAATARASFTIEPVRPGVPRLIGPLIADRLARTGDPLPSATRPFRFGEALVTPRMENRVPRAEPFALFVEVEGDQPVALDWSFTREGEPFGTPGHLDDARGIRAWEIKGGTLEPGRYEVRVRARMSEGEAAERTLVFDIAP